MTIEEQVPLSRFTTLGTGGPARWFAKPESVDELAEALEWAGERELSVAVVGLGSNLLVADDGVDGLVLKLAGELASVEVDGEAVRAGAVRRSQCVSTAPGPPGSAGSSSRARSPEPWAGACG